MRTTSKPAAATKADPIGAYLASFPRDVQAVLRRVRKTIKQAVPAAEESMSYGMPAYKLNGKAVVYFAGYAKHVGFYATPTGHAAFKKQLAAYKQGKGSVQFPLDQPVPYGLIAEIASFRAKAAPTAKRMPKKASRPTSKR
jgi:uncharacterized protein YdhG (YjbR/CyaY superfamily)